MTRLSTTALIVTLGTFVLTSAQSITVPRIWDDASLADWATPVAGLNVRPSHYSSAEYYASPADNLRTYPVYHPDHEPPGYWERLQQQKPEPLVVAEKMRTMDDWVAAGERVFREMDSPLLRTNDPALIAQLRDPGRRAGTPARSDGTLAGPQRWVITPQGVMATVSACASCHAGEIDVPAATGRPRQLRSTPVGGRGGPLAGAPGTAWRLERFYSSDPFPVAFWREFTVPWSVDDRVERFRSMSVADMQQLAAGNYLGRSFGGGVFARSNGSPYAPTKIVDLQNLRYSRYVDATATHRLRGPEDVARYAALVTGADRMDFGPHRILTDEQRRVRFHYADEVLYALGVYLMSLEPPTNPHTAPPTVILRGEEIFRREGCAGCHAPPAYTTGRLTVAQGFVVPTDHPNREDIMPVSVETNPDAALKTRKGTGLYKIPSLRGAWYRPRLLHDGSLSSLEEMFDPRRLGPDYRPSGWNPPGVETRPVPGHRFGLSLAAEDKSALLAFLRSL